MNKRNIDVANIRLTEEWHDEKWAWEVFITTKHYNPNSIYTTYPQYDQNIITILEIII